jgi:hypothetical protein
MSEPFVTTIVKRADGEPLYFYENIAANRYGWLLRRFAVPGGWLVFNGSSSPGTFVSDPDHSWRIETRDETRSEADDRELVSLLNRMEIHTAAVLQQYIDEAGEHQLLQKQVQRLGIESIDQLLVLAQQGQAAQEKGLSKPETNGSAKRGLSRLLGG